MTTQAAKKLEGKFQKEVQRDLDKLAKIYHLKIQQVGLCGDPDMVLTVHGWSVYLELKRDGKDARPLQEFKLRQMHFAGAFTFVPKPENWATIYSFLIYLSENPPSNLGATKYVYDSLRYSEKPKVSKGNN